MSGKGSSGRKGRKGSSNACGFPSKGAEGHNFSGGDDSTTVIGFELPQLALPSTARAGGVVSAASASTATAGAAPRGRIALAGGRHEVSRHTMDKPIFVAKLFHRAFRFLDPRARLGPRVESILGTTTFKFLRNLVEKMPPYASDLHLLNGMMFSFFNLDHGQAHVWSRQEDELLDAITDKGRKIMVHKKVFLPAVLGGRKLGSRLISKQVIALPPALVEQFKPDIFTSRKQVTADIFFKVTMIVFIVRFVQRIHAYLQLTGSHTVSEALLHSVNLNGVFAAPVPSASEQAAWAAEHPELVPRNARRARRGRRHKASTIIVLPSRNKRNKRKREEAALGTTSTSS